MRSHLVQTNFSNGVVSEEYRASVQDENYYKSIQVGDNVVVTPTGGIKRRGGLEKFLDESLANRIADEKIYRIEPFFINEDEKFVITFQDTGVTAPFIYIYAEDGTLIQAIATTSSWNVGMVKEIDIVQAVETMVFTHETTAPYTLERTAGVWAFNGATILNMPFYNFTTRQIEVNTGAGPSAGYEAIFSVTRGFPRTVTIFQGRLWFGGTPSLPMLMASSQLNSFFDFDIAAGDSNAIFDFLEYQQMNPITAIYAGRQLQVFTSGNEFVNTSAFITQTDSAWKSQTNYGAVSVKPVSIDGSVLFVDRTRKNIRQHVYDDGENAFIGLSVNRKSSDITNDIQALAVVRGTASDTSDYLIAVNGDGTVAVMNSYRVGGIEAWTKWTTTLGEFKDVMVLDDTVYFLTERFGITYIEKLNNNLHTDLAYFEEVAAPITYDVVHFRDEVVHNGNEVVHTTGTPTGILTIFTEYNLSILNNNNSANERERFLELIMDDNLQDRTNLIGNDWNNFIIPSRTVYKVEVGINYPVRILTMPLNAQTKGGYGVNLRKRVIRVILHLLNSKAVILEDKATHNRQYPVPFNSSVPNFTGIKEVYLMGYGRLVEIEITQDEPFPMTVLSIDAEVEV